MGPGGLGAGAFGGRGAGGRVERSGSGDSSAFQMEGDEPFLQMMLDWLDDDMPGAFD